MLEGLKEANGLLKEKPPVSQVKAQLATLSEKYIQKMVALGKFRETFNEDDKQLSHNHFYTAQFTAEFTEAQSEHNSFHNVYQQYRDEYPDFWKSYNSLLYLGDYAEFEMLKQNLPDEAVRLSIK